ncbi:MAG: hypothetical protein II881_01510 [Oscillospiraceae bacterium]|nr:hypothetical protein [Oscillospiraceae bacterium]
MVKSGYSATGEDMKSAQKPRRIIKEKKFIQGANMLNGSRVGLNREPFSLPFIMIFPLGESVLAMMA